MNISTTAADPQEQTSRSSLYKLYFGRGAIAIVWAILFGTVSSSLTGGAIALLLIYPAIDVASSIIDARTHRGAGPGRMQMVNAAISSVTLLGIALASNRNSVAAVMSVFGAWASVSGLVQLIVAVRRRAQVGHQWAMYFSGGLSTLAGIGFATMAHSADPKLSNLGGYAGFGGVLFVISAFLLMRRNKKQ
jgi:uncharacterized membrane protein HdeD (DUF308 family)